MAAPRQTGTITGKLDLIPQCRYIKLLACSEVRTRHAALNLFRSYIMNIRKLSAPFLLVLVLALFSSGCATLTRGTTESYQVLSDPAGAHVTLSSGETCTTPCTLEKKRGDSFAVKIEKAGYQPYKIMVNSESCEVGQAALAGNLLLIGTVIWASIDSLNGSTMQLTPNPCQVTLVPTGKSSGG